jgi:hypothetical protein
MRTIDIERLLREDAIEKKKAGRGEAHRASRKKGFKGSVKFPVDLLRGKERRKYMGEETVLGIITFQEFLNSEKEQRRKMLENLLSKYSRKELAEKWGISPRSLGAHIYQVGGNLPGGSRRKSKPKPKPIQIEGKIETFNPPKFGITMSLESKGEELQNRLRNVVGTLLRDKKYTIEMTITEIGGEE